MPKSPRIIFTILTLFPDFFNSPLQSSIIGKAIKKGLIEINIVNIRDFGLGKRKQVDDKPFGGGPGMVIRADVLAEAVKSLDPKAKPFKILLDPSGKKLNQALVQNLAKKKHIVLIAGHYEGIDERFKKGYVDLEISVGDYILSGGEIPSLVLLDSTSRLISGVLGNEESKVSESFALFDVGKRKARLLDYPVYTKPLFFEGISVPKILLSGNHQKIAKWRLESSLKKTSKTRPDLLQETT